MSGTISTKEWSKDETVKLIETVQLYPMIWDPRNSDYRNRVKKNSAVQDVSKEFGVTPEEMQRKWHNLRTQYNNEVRKVTKKKSGAGTADVPLQSTWEYFNAMKFVGGSAIISETLSNVVSESTILMTVQLAICFHVEPP